MVDFGKRLKEKSKQKETNPTLIYNGLDRSSDTGPLRPAQETILNSWFTDFKNKKDVIVKLHTGQGKTLIGLLILLSRLNQTKRPCMYVCPNIYLVDQTCEQAKKFGVPFIRFDSTGNMPPDFLNGEAILITHVQKVFNGLSKFKLNSQSIDVDTIVLDDSHACIDSIKDSFTIKLKNDHECYYKLKELFSDDLKEQGQGTFIEIDSGEYESILPVSYWAWEDKIDRVMEVLSSKRESDEIKFAWPLIKDHLIDCQCIFSGTSLQIVPHFNPLNQFRSFENADHRVLMSATTLDDSSFVKGLRFSKDAIITPLADHNEKWSGEKMIIIPFLIDDQIDRVTFISEYAKPKKRDKGIVALLPSSKLAEPYVAIGSETIKTENIFEKIKQLKTGSRNTPLVIVNRYDGIDLPDDSCRLLIFDSKPVATNLIDRYEEACRPNSDLLIMKTAQKIEQGLGRSVRGEKDYSVIVIIGEELVNFIRTKRNYKFFSDQTLKQIEIGIEIAQIANESTIGSSGKEQISDLIKKCTIDRDRDWRQFYSEQMDTIVHKTRSYDSLEILELESQAEDQNLKGHPEKAVDAIQKIVNKITNNDYEKGWYLQQLARLQYRISKIESLKTQQAAFKLNNQLLKPKEGFTYKKISFISLKRIDAVKKWLISFINHEEMYLQVSEILSNLDFSRDSDQFEEALKELGKALGFISERPDKENKAGPDNLWCGEGDSYFLFECKNEVKEDRKVIKKDEAGQMNTSIAWFKREYRDIDCTKFMIIHTHEVDANAAFIDRDIRIIKKGDLKKLKGNVLSFFKEFKEINLSDVSDRKIQDLINQHELDIASLKTKYSRQHHQR